MVVGVSDSREKTKYTLWDLAGSKNYRQVWHSYLEEADLIVFMIDGADSSKYDDAAQSIRGLIENEPKLHGKTLLFLVNKSVLSSDSSRTRTPSTCWQPPT